MKTIFIVSFLYISIHFGYSQELSKDNEEYKFQMVPGKRIGFLEIGLQYDSVISLAGSPDSILTKKQVIKWFDEENIDTNQWIPFRIKFDKMIIYYDCLEYPLYLAYFDNNKLVLSFKSNSN